MNSLTAQLGRLRDAIDTSQLGDAKEALRDLELSLEYVDELQDVVLRHHGEHHDEVDARWCSHEPCKVAAGW